MRRMKSWLAKGWPAWLMLGLMAGCGKTRTHAPVRLLVQTVRAEVFTPGSRGSAPGYIAIIRGDTETDFSFKVRGILESIGTAPGQDWNEGAHLPAGAVLAKLKTADFDNALVSASAKRKLAEETLARLSQLRSSEAISPQELDIAKADAENARGQLAQAEQNLKDSVLQAPFEGVVLTRYANSGVTLEAGQKVLRFARNDRMSVELGVPDRLIDGFWPGKSVPVEISAFEGRAPFAGQVSEVGIAASAEGRLFRVVIKVENPAGLIRSGMTATVRIGSETRAPAGAVLVPLSALVTLPGAGAAHRRLAVYVVQQGTVSQRPVKTGDIVESSIIVAEGLKSGEEVVASGASLLYEGAPVEVVANPLETR